MACMHTTCHPLLFTIKSSRWQVFNQCLGMSDDLDLMMPDSIGVFLQEAEDSRAATLGDSMDEHLQVTS